jgi:IS5 family transposase
VFHVLKRQFGFAKVRYRGLMKNANRVFTALALVNLVMAQRRRPALVRP